MWRTWKPYAVIGAVIVVAAVVFFWLFGPLSASDPQQDSEALQDGSYTCSAVYVNEAGEYEPVMGSQGETLDTEAEIRNGELVSLVGDSALDPEEVAALTVISDGDSHFHVTDRPDEASYDALACDFAN